MEHKLKYMFMGIGVSIIIFLFFGSISAVLPNPFFIRMMPATFLDKIFLASSSLLLGAYISINYYKKNTANKCDIAASTGGIGSFLAFACPLCNKVLVILFSATALMAYFEQYRPILGFASNGLLFGVIWWRIKQ